MKIKYATTISLLLLYSSSTFAAVPSVPEIDGALSIQALSLLGGVLYLLRRKK